MLPRHPSHLDLRPLPARLSIPILNDIHNHVFEKVEGVDVREGFAFGFGRGVEVGFGVRGGDYGEGAAEGGFNFFVEVVAVGW